MTDHYANKEILSVCLHYMNNYAIKEVLLDFVPLEGANGASIAEGIITSLQSNSIDISKCRGQVYDGASCMSSQKVGVQSRIKALSPLALNMHCRCHVLNLSIASACSIPVIKNMIGVINEVYLFFNLSPKRQNYFEHILKAFDSQHSTTKIKGLCKTRWVERHAYMF